MTQPLSRAPWWRRYGYVLVTGILFLGSFLGQWLSHDGTATEFWNAVLENWQSEFLQLVWQVAGLAILLHVGSPQSKEGDDRLEAKVDELLRRAKGERAEAFLDRVDDLYGRH